MQQLQNASNQNHTLARKYFLIWAWSTKQKRKLRETRTLGFHATIDCIDCSDQDANEQNTLCTQPNTAWARVPQLNTACPRREEQILWLNHENSSKSYWNVLIRHTTNKHRLLTALVLIVSKFLQRLYAKKTLGNICERPPWEHLQADVVSPTW